jgi:hypothetical protein
MPPPIQVVDLSEATLDRIGAMIARAADEIASRMTGQVVLDGFSGRALDDLSDVINSALSERE